MEQMRISMDRVVGKLNSFDWADKELYSDWLAQSYYYTSYSTRMLAFAASWTDTAEQGYYRRSLQHIREEQGHDLIAKNDLEKLGGSLSNLHERGVTRSLWEPQFYKMQKSPAALLGYILALEELAVKTFGVLHTKLSEVYPKEACRFVQVHADDDPDHVEEALKQIEACTPEQREAIYANYVQTCDLYRLMLEEIEAAV